MVNFCFDLTPGKIAFCKLFPSCLPVSVMQKHLASCFLLIYDRGSKLRPAKPFHPAREAFLIKKNILCTKNLLIWQNRKM